MRDIFRVNIPTRLKQKAFNQYILPVLAFDAETLTLPKKTTEKLKVTQRRLERLKLDLTLKDQARIEEIRLLTVGDDIIPRVIKQKWKWATHIARKQDRSRNCGDQELTGVAKAELSPVEQMR